MIMEYQKITNLLGNASNQPYKFKTKNWVEINDESRGTYTSNDNKFKTTMLRSNLCDYTDAYTLVKETITITGAGDDDAAKWLDERNKGVIFKNCALFTKCLSRKNNTDLDNAQDIDIVIPMYNLIEYSDNYSKTSGSLWQYCKEDPNDNIRQSESFKSILTWSPTCVISSATGEIKFNKITETKFYVSVVTQDNAKLLQQLKSGFKRTINWNKYESNIKIFAQNRHVNHLINPSKQTFCMIFWE